MLTGQGLIGKLVLFMAEKLLGQKIALSLDEKKRACRAFVELYYCLDRLEDINSKVVELLNFGVKHGGILPDDLGILMRPLNTVSQRFIEARGELYYAISLIDPLLTSTISQIYSAKGSFLLMMSEGIEVKYASISDRDVIEYYIPNPRILNIDMNAYEQWVIHFSATEKYDQDRLEWPQSLLWFGEFEEGFQPEQLLLTDKTSLMKFQAVLQEHGKAISDAREKLRALISKNFSTENILYVSKGMPKDEI